MIPHLIRLRRQLAATFICCALIGVTPVQAAEIAPSDLSAAVRALGFLDSLQRRSPIVVGVVYRSSDTEAKNAAQRAAVTLAGLKGPNGSAIEAPLLVASELGQATRRVDAVYIASGASDGGRVVTDFVRRQHVPSISNDPACLSAQTCVLMVRASARTEIILDTAMARDTGATFSSVFMMMVKRK